MTKQEAYKALQDALEKARALRDPKLYIRLGWGIQMIAERLHMTEDEVRDAINECREKEIRLGDMALNAMIMMDCTVPEMIEETGWTESEIRIYMNRGATLKATREADGFTSGEVALRFDVPLREITRLEAGNYGDEPILQRVGALLMRHSDSK